MIETPWNHKVQTEKLRSFGLIDEKYILREKILLLVPDSLSIEDVNEGRYNEIVLWKPEKSKGYRSVVKKL